MLKCEEANAFKRLIDSEATKKEFDRLMEERLNKRKKLREEERAAKLTELQAEVDGDEEATPEDKAAKLEEEMAKWDEERDAAEEAEDEDDPDKPNLEAMMTAQQEAITTQIEADQAFLGEFAEALREKGIPVIDDINTDTSAEFVFVKLVDRLKANFQMRPDLLERQQAQSLKPAELPNYEVRSYTYQQSKFGKNSPLS